MQGKLPFQAPESPNWLRVWMGLLVLWAIFAVLGTWFNYRLLIVTARPISWSQSIRMNVTEYGIWAMLLTPFVLFLCARLPLGRRQLFRIVPAHLLSIAAVVCVDVSIQSLLASRVYLATRTQAFVPQFREYFLADAETDVHIYLLIAVVGYVVAYYSELRNQEQHAADLETSLARAELQVLKMQLQPHFLFNTLHSVAALVNTDPRAAQRMICSLGDLLRMTLAADHLPKMTLSRELEFLDMYLDIQRVRLQDRLVVETNVADEVLDALVPYLLLQPLVENAIKHGVARRPGLGRIEICIRKQFDCLNIFVVNEIGTSFAVPEQDRLGIGLENVRGRLRILYGSSAELSAKDLCDGRFQVEVRIPFEAFATSHTNAPPVSVSARHALEIAR